MDSESSESYEPRLARRAGVSTQGLTKTRLTNWSFSVPELGYAGFCLSCGIRATSHPFEECPYPEHLRRYTQAQELRRHPTGTKPKSKDGAGWTVRRGRYGRPACSSCQKEPNCSPSKDCTREEHHIYYERSRDKLRTKHWETKVKVIELLGGKCANCGIADIRLLQVNHKARESHLASERRSSTKLFNWILRGKLPMEAYDLRCANCNILYEYQLGHVSVQRRS